MRRPNTVEKGFLKAVVLVLGVAILEMPLLHSVPAADPELMRGLASLGTGLLLAYVVEAVWAIRRMRTAADYEDRLGVFVGLAALGLLAVVVALLIGAHRTAGHSNLLDCIGLAFVAASLVLLGAMVVCQPLLVHEWEAETPTD